jgi:hypothetical protein
MSVSIKIPGTTVSIELSSLSLYSIKDSPSQQRITVHVRKLPLSFVIWDGSTEYAAASAWTNESVTERATELLTLSADNIQWVY